MRQPILRANLRVGAIWWIGLTIWSSWGSRDIGEVWQAVTDQGQYGLLGAVVGTAAVLIFTKLSRAGLVGYLSPSADHGIGCSLGPVPRAIPFLVLAEKPILPSRKGGNTKLDVLQKYRDDYSVSSPAHVALLDSLLAIFADRMHLPATHVEGDHGYSTLFEHSLLVAGVMQETAKQWKYEGIKNKAGDVVTPLRRPDYHFKPDDPIIYLVGLAHDIGKIESYRFDAKGKIVGTRHEHDLVGARMLARISTFWGLPVEDRDALTLAVGFYHHPQAMPLDEGGIVRDDRTIALMELLITADRLAGKIESQHPYDGPSETQTNIATGPLLRGNSNAESPIPAQGLDSKQVAIQEESVDIRAPRVYQAFVELCGEADRINCPDHSTNIGQKYGEYLVFHGESLSKWLCRNLGVKDETLGDGRHKILDDLLQAFEAKDILYNEFEGQRYSASRAYWDVAFSSRSEKENGKPKPLRGWRHAIIIRPGKVLPGLASLSDNNAFMEVLRCSWSANAAKNKRRVLNEAEQADKLDAEKQASPIMSLLQQRADAEAAQEGTLAQSTLAIDTEIPSTVAAPTTTATAAVRDTADQTPPWETPAADPISLVTAVAPSAAPAAEAASIMSDIDLLFGATATPALVPEPPQAQALAQEASVPATERAPETSARTITKPLSRKQENSLPSRAEKSVLEAMTERVAHRNQPLRRSKLEKIINGLIDEPQSPLVLREGWYKTYWALLEPKLPPGLAAEILGYRDGFVPEWIRFEEHDKNGIKHQVIAFLAAHFNR